MNKKDAFYLDPTNHIVRVVMPLKKEAQNKARHFAREHVNAMKAVLEACGWNLDKAAPRPHAHMKPLEYRTAAQRRAEFQTVFPWRDGVKRMGEDLILKYDAQRAGEFMQDAYDHAGLQYDAFVAKLIKKIGPVTQAAISGSHVWGYSFLRVWKAATPDDVQEVWKTQQITNVSKFGKVFNQWPSRKVKAAEEDAIW